MATTAPREKPVQCARPRPGAMGRSRAGERMKRIGILTAGGDTPALNATIQGAVVRANQRPGRGLRLHQGIQQPPPPHRSPRPPEPALHRDPGARPHPRRHPHRRLPRLRRRERHQDPRRRRPSALAPGHRRPHLRGRRRHPERPAALRGALPDRARAQDHRQRPRPQLPQRARGVGAQARAHGRRLHLRAHGLADLVRPRGPDQLRDARLRHLGVRLLRGRAADPHHRREPPAHRHHRGDGPALRLHRPGLRLRPARHHPRPRAPAERGPALRAGLGDLRAAEERGDRLRRGDRGRDAARSSGPSTPRTTPRATWC